MSLIWNDFSIRQNSHFNLLPSKSSVSNTKNQERKISLRSVNQLSSKSPSKSQQRSHSVISSSTVKRNLSKSPNLNESVEQEKDNTNSR